MPGKETKAEETSRHSAETLSNISLAEYKKREPLLDQLLSRSMSFMDTGDIGVSPYYDPIKNAVEDQMALAKGRALENLPTGGALEETIGNIFSEGTTTLLDQLIMQELGQAYSLGTGGTQIAIQGLGGASSSLANLAGAQAARASGEQSAGASTASMCSFIFTATYGKIHPVVRRYRNEYTTIRNRRGYYWFSDIVVPIMKKHKLFKSFMKLVMTAPMTCYGLYRYKYGKIGIIFAPLTSFWLRLFSLLGFRKPYRRKGTMEVV